MDRSERTLRSPLLERLGVGHGFSTRCGGASLAPWDSLNLSLRVGDDPAAGRETLSRFARDVGVDPARIFSAGQVHGTRILALEPHHRPDDLRDEQADGLATDRPDQAVSVRTADCAPVLLASDDGRVVAAVHAGWRGIVAGVVQAGIRTLEERYGVGPERLVAAVGPCIGPCCYEVGAELIEAFESVGLAGSVLAGEHPHADLRKAVRTLLEAEGVLADRIDVLDLCTSCRADLFFSYRRDRGRGGRQLALISPKRS